MTFEFDSNGFLADQAIELESKIRDSYGNLFRGAVEINRECHNLLLSPSISRDDGRALLTATLFMRALEHYQATIILLGKGLIAAARVTLRALVETVFRLRAIATHDDAWKTFILEDEAYRLKIINKARQNRYPNLEETRTAATDELVEKLKEGIKTTGAKALSTEEWSKRAGMHDWYITNYTLLSKAVHTQVRDLEVYLGTADEVRGLVYAPSIDEVRLLIPTAAQLLLIAASAFDKMFEVGFGPKGDEFNKFVESAFLALDTEAT